ncbi:MAG: Gfo/Idh/MocA family oxidoreductase [Eubacteriales bacterium]|nr:Gfo/Idh/MocA family oxidoreductase [Eubacteriales bacterium]
MKQVNCAVVGLGAIGPTHVKSINAIPQANLYAVCDVVKEKADRVAAENGCKAYYDFDELLKDENVQLVHLCVPSGYHAELGVKAAKAGKHVLTEKPIDVTLEAADRLIRACDEAGVMLSCISQHRFDDAMERAHAALEQGWFGTLTFGGSHTKWYRSQEYYDSGDWRGTWKLDGGGALMNQSVHYVDMLQYMMGPVEEVTAYCATRAHVNIEVEDVATAILKFKNGAIGILEGNTAAFPGFHTRLDINGTTGSVILENDEIREWRFAAEGEQSTGFYGKISGAQEGQGSGHGASTAAIGSSSHEKQITDVVNAILEGRAPRISGRDARAPLAVILAVYESARTGKPVKVG